MRQTLLETKTFLDSYFGRPSVSRALIYKWLKRFSDGRGSTRDIEISDRPAVADERTFTLVKEVIDTDQCF